MTSFCVSYPIAPGHDHTITFVYSVLCVSSLRICGVPGLLRHHNPFRSVPGCGGVASLVTTYIGLKKEYRVAVDSVCVGEARHLRALD